MIEVTLPPGNQGIKVRSGAFVTTHSPTLELHKWLEEKGMPCVYQPLWGTHPSGDLRNAPSFYGLRFKFEDERMAVMFKLTWGGA